METRKVETMVSGPRRYERVAKAEKNQATDTDKSKFNAIVRCKMDIREDSCCSGKNWYMLSTTGQLCDVKVFHNSYEAITNVPVGRSATEMVHDEGSV